VPKGQNIVVYGHRGSNDGNSISGKYFRQRNRFSCQSSISPNTLKVDNITIVMIRRSSWIEFATDMRSDVVGKYYKSASYYVSCIEQLLDGVFIGKHDFILKIVPIKDFSDSISLLTL